MSKPKVIGLLKTIQKGVSKHSPEILTAIGIGGMLSATVMAVKATPKAMKLIEKEQETKPKLLTPMEKVKVAWKPYVPTIATAVVSTACLIGANSVHAKRNAALATAYKLSETALTELRQAVAETVDEETVQEIREKVSEKRIEANPVVVQNIYHTGNGDDLFYDYLSDRYFYSSFNAIDAAINRINRNILHGDMYASLNDLYSEIGLPRNGLGDDVGWNVDNEIEIPHDEAIITKDGKSCAVLTFLTPPTHKYDSLY